MKLTILTILASITAAVAQSPFAAIGGSCSGAGYSCAESRHQVAVCNGGNWLVAADCGECQCVQPSGELAPRCASC
ncbi:hypothetical protein BJX99DRAFT_48348 [Aspergillus californicus]